MKHSGASKTDVVNKENLTEDSFVVVDQLPAQPTSENTTTDSPKPHISFYVQFYGSILEDIKYITSMAYSTVFQLEIARGILYSYAKLKV